MSCRRWLPSLGLALTLALSAVPLWPAAGLAITLPPPTVSNSGIFGDFLVYSLPLIGIPVKSTPGAIKDGIVVYTGAEGGPVTTNFSGMDNAFPSVSGSCGGPCYFSTETTSDPGGLGQFTGDAQSWDSTLSAFLGFLGSGKTPLFFFNQNETNSGPADPSAVGNCGMTAAQDLCVYGQVVLRKADGTGTVKTFEFEGPPYPTSWPVPIVTDGIPTLPAEYVLAKGAICLDASGAPTGCDGVPNPVAFGPVNHNLGADQAAWAVLSPALNAALAACVGNIGGTGCPWDTLSIRLDLDGLSNGYEQLFILTEDAVTLIPEPTSLLLWGMTAVGVAVAWRRRGAWLRSPTRAG